MSLIVSLIAAAVFAVLCAKPLRRAPWAFYLLAILVAAGGIYLTYQPVSNTIVRSVVFAIQKGQVAFSLFAVVMFVGAFGQDSKVRRLLNPVRAELSIIAAVLIVGHFVPYLSNYLGHAANLLSLRPSILGSLTIALVLLVLLALLTVTSLNAVKKRMDSGRWKAIQRLAYPFFGLIFLHLIGYLLIPALNGSMRAILGVAVYTTIFGVYALLRARRTLRDRQAELRQFRPIV
jgi:DMSO/TMAO reductase YedYZ heme-binding membrane subunit